MRQINAIISLRRDNDYNFEKIKDTFVPAQGEVVLVDTASTGLRLKVGDGMSTYGSLPYADEEARSNIVHGYYENGVFYDNLRKDNELVPDLNKFYVDTSANNAYFYNGQRYINLQGMATAQSAGMMYLYDELGQNTNGTVTQRKITQEFNARYKTSVDEDEELLILSL